MRARPEIVAEHFELDEPPELAARYNIAPGQSIATIRSTAAGTRAWELRSWGLVPGWAKDPAIANRMINARGETVAEKPAFRAAFARRRCLIPADGFYEWAAGTKPKQPFLIARPEGGVFAFAGLFEEWEDGDGVEVHSCTIVTTAANATLAPIHARMPVILDPGDYGLWLGERESDAAARQALLAPCPDTWLTAKPVGFAVNDARRDAPECAAPAPAAPAQGSLL